MTDRSHREKMHFDEQHGAAVNFCSVCRSESLCVQVMKKFIGNEKC